MLRTQSALVTELQAEIHNQPDSRLVDGFLSIAETIFEPANVHSAPASAPTAAEQFLGKIFLAFYEIFEAYQTLIDLPALSSSKPPRYSTISESGLVRFWREAYLNEYYIFEERLRGYIRCLQRCYRKDPRVPKLGELGDGILAILEEDSEILRQMRSIHVHRQRYFHSDPELQRVQMLEMLASGSPVRGLMPIYRQALRHCRSQTKHDFRIFNLKAKDALKGVFDSFESLILDKNGKLMYPSSIK
jgi:hypothetical protein